MTRRKRVVVMRSDLPPWTPFERDTLRKKPLLKQLENNEALAKRFGTTVDAVQRQLDSIEREEEIWTNSRYQVNIRRRKNEDPSKPDMIHLSIKRLDKEQIGRERYRDFMQIRDELAPGIEMCEVYPVREREIDTSNQFHLWGFDDPEFRLPFGWFEGRKVFDWTPGNPGGAVQSPFEPHHRIT